MCFHLRIFQMTFFENSSLGRVCLLSMVFETVGSTLEWSWHEGVNCSSLTMHSTAKDLRAKTKWCKVLVARSNLGCQDTSQGSTTDLELNQEVLQTMSKGLSAQDHWKVCALVCKILAINFCGLSTVEWFFRCLICIGVSFEHAAGRRCIYVTDQLAFMNVCSDNVTGLARPHCPGLSWWESVHSFASHWHFSKKKNLEVRVPVLQQLFHFERRDISWLWLGVRFWGGENLWLVLLLKVCVCQEIGKHKYLGQCARNLLCDLWETMIQFLRKHGLEGWITQNLEGIQVGSDSNLYTCATSRDQGGAVWNQDPFLDLLLPQAVFRQVDDSTVLHQVHPKHIMLMFSTKKSGWEWWACVWSSSFGFKGLGRSWWQWGSPISGALDGCALSSSQVIFNFSCSRLGMSLSKTILTVVFFAFDLILLDAWFWCSFQWRMQDV